MPILPVHDVFFDDKATLAMGAAFDRACRSLRQFLTTTLSVPVPPAVESVP